MNKQTISSIIKIANTLDNSGYYKEANMLTKVAYDVSPNDIIMPGESRQVNNTTDKDSTEITLENIQEQYMTLVNTIKSLPNEHNGDDYFRTLKRNLYHSTFEVGVKISSLMTQAGMDTDKIDEFHGDL